MSNDLSGKTALVTGSSRGIGRAIALLLAQKGANVAINYLQDQSAAYEAVKLVTEAGVQSMAIKADVREVKQVRQMIDKIESTFTKLDILVNNVGAILYKPLSRTNINEWKSMIDGNLHSAFCVCKAALPGMRERGYGRIVNIAVANTAQVHSYDKITPYAIAKTGLLILTKSLAVEEGEHGITVNAVSPGFIAHSVSSDKEREKLEAKIPMKRLGEPEEVAQAVLFLVSDAASYITGTNLLVSGGWGI